MRQSFGPIVLVIALCGALFFAMTGVANEGPLFDMEGRQIPQHFFESVTGALSGRRTPRTKRWTLVRDMVQAMNINLTSQASQTSQLDIASLVFPDDFSKLNETLLIELLQSEKLGSILNSPSSMGKTWVPTVQEWRERQQRIYELSTQYGNQIPILYGLDSVHGCNYIFNATLFPQQIAMAATFNDQLVHDVGRVTALESRYAGVPWAFSPILGLAVQPTWARVYETFGEDPLLVTRMGVAIVKGLQTPAPSWMNPPNVSGPWRFGGSEVQSPAGSTPTTGAGSGSNSDSQPSEWEATNSNGAVPLVAACLKHYIGYPNARTGHDRTPVWLPFNILMQYFAQSFDSAINDAEAISIMENYVEINGRPTVGSELLLQFMLRKVMGFTGMLVTDYNEVYNLYDFHKTVNSYEEAAVVAFRDAQIDMAMISNPPPVLPFFADFIVQQTIPTGGFPNAFHSIPPARVRQAANRVLTMKHTLGLFHGSPVWPEPTRCAFACKEHRDLGLKAVHESATLLQNNGNVLPLNVAALNTSTGPRKRIVLIGEACNSVPLMAGGWTINWQGTSNKSAFPYGSTLFEEFTARFPYANVTFHYGCNVTEDSTCSEGNLTEAVSAASTADVVLLCLGERHYAEKPGDIDDLTLPGQQIEMVRQIAAVVPNGVPFVGVLIEGRPRVLGPIPDLVPALLHGYLPGPSGGQGLTDILLGLVDPSGRLPISYPRTVNNSPQQYWRKYSGNTSNDYNVQLAFGHGMHYAMVTYDSMNLTISLGVVCTSVFVTNHGDHDVLDTVLLFSRLQYRPIAPEVAMLQNFSKVLIPSGATVRVDLNISLNVFSYVDELNCWGMQPSLATLWVGNAWSNITSDQPSQMIYTEYAIPHVCGLWGTYYHEKTYGGNAVNVNGNTDAGKQQTSDFVISSIVCFGAGVVGTFILVQWLVLRRKRKEAALLSMQNQAENDAPQSGYDAVTQRNSTDEDAPYRIGAEHISLPQNH